nr:adenylate/guanylate cyclase domain-containing protein [Gammaproteobacteria bacterium]NIV73449.1 adenylate/guanylate cyclase domain-containing protein [Gammaproteobacteria bacterium]
FDRIVEQFGCERIKTLGDAYVAVCGIPEPVPDHAQHIAEVALRFVRYLERRNESQTQKWRCRIGLGSDPVIGSIVGVQKYVYDIFGPGVNLAARMEALSDPMEISLSGEMARVLAPKFRVEDQGEVELKGFGVRRRFTLVGAHAGSDAYNI